MRRTRTAAAILGPILVASIVLGPVPGRSATATGWSIVAGPNTFGQWVFQDVAAVGASDVWAVGVRGGNTGTLAEHWDGSSWTVSSTLDPDALGDRLHGVAAADATHVWAVGVGLTMSGGVPLIERWNGTDWSQDAAPGDGTLWGVGALSATDAWAVGSTMAGTTLIERWNGSSWSIVPSADPSTNDILYAVAPISGTDVWAVGRSDAGTLLEHWNGSAWTASTVGGGSLTGIAAFATDDVWAVGHGLATHWDGSTWTAASLPVPADGTVDLAGVAGSGPHDVWAVGASGAETLIEHWDGADWSVVPSPNPTSPPPNGGASFTGVASVSATDAWAVGTDPWSENTLAARFAEGDFTSALSAAGPLSVYVGDASNVVANLAFSSNASAAGETVHRSRHDPNGTVEDLGDAVTDAYGHVAFGDVVGAKGTYTYTATFDGQGIFPGSTDSVQLTVTGRPTSVSLSSGRGRIVVGGSVVFAADLNGPPPGAPVALFRKIFGHGWAKIATGSAGAGGAVAFRLRPTLSAIYQARFAGDATYAASSSGTVHVEVAAIVRITALGGYATKAGVRRYHFSEACVRTHRQDCPVFLVSVTPKRPHAAVTIQLWAFERNAWRPVGTTTPHLDGTGQALVAFFYRDGSVMGLPLRIGAEVGDNLSGDAISPFARFMITR
ncbi:MAG TPA: hypothetical protein VK646_01485 [Actinomycetota bacterium]|nr:hypothetical protein [Actinomycetota bacterium]